MAPKPKTGTKTTASKPKGPSNPELDFNNNKNTFLFKTPGAYDKFHDKFSAKNACELFHALRNEKSRRIYDFVIQFPEFWKFTGLLAISDPGYETLIRLFYANATFNDQTYQVTSWLFGNPVVINPSTLCEWFGLEVNQDQECFYHRRQNEWLGDESYEQMCEYMHGDPPYHNLTNFEPRQRIVFHFVNNILAPVAALKTNLERRNIYLLRHLWYKSKSINIPFLIYHHMQYFSQIGNLPYGNILTWICNKLNIEIPRAIKINPLEKVPNHDLLDLDRYANSYNLKPFLCDFEPYGFFTLKKRKVYHSFPPLNEHGQPLWPPNTESKTPESLARALRALNSPVDPAPENPNPPIETAFNHEPPLAPEVDHHDLDDDDAVDFDYTTGTTDQVLRAMARRQTRDLAAILDGQQELRIRQDESEARFADFTQQHNLMYNDLRRIQQENFQTLLSAFNSRYAPGSSSSNPNPSDFGGPAE
jgi:hypothetical protein